MSRFPRDALILGCAPLGGLYHIPIPFSQVRDVIKAAVLRHNIHNIDTAPWYGTGKSESDIGKILETDPKLIDQPVNIYTKVGRVIKRRDECFESDPRVEFGDTCYAIVPENKDFVPLHDYTAEGIKEAATQSRKRLGIEPNDTNPKHRIAGLRLHDCEKEDRFNEAVSKGGIAELLSEQVNRQDLNNGPCEASLGMNSPEYVLKILRAVAAAQQLSKNSNAGNNNNNNNNSKAPLAALKNNFSNILIAGCWNLIDQSGLTVFEYCESVSKTKITIHNAGIFGAGLLWGGDHYRYGKADKEALNERDRWAEVAADVSVSLPALAFAFAFLPTPVTKIVFGAATEKELDACVAAADEAASKLLSNDEAMKKMILLAEKKQLFEPGVAAKCLEWMEQNKTTGIKKFEIVSKI